jgi:hypothetical protein
MKYPIYRRNHSTRVFYKIIGENQIMTIRVTNNETRVSLSRSAYKIVEALQDSRTRQASPDEFVKLFKEADVKFLNAMPEA